MMWEIKGKPIDPKRLEPFEPVRVLNYYDGPRIFTFFDADGGLCLAVWSDEDSKHSRFLVVAVADQIIADLEAGLLTVREALNQPRLWVVDYADGTGHTEAWLTTLDNVPKDAQPQPRTMLHRSLEPILSLRATGEAIRPGEIPGSVIRGTVEGAQKAIKCLAEYELDWTHRPAKVVRHALSISFTTCQYKKRSPRVLKCSSVRHSSSRTYLRGWKRVKSEKRRMCWLVLPNTFIRGWRG